MVEIVYQECGNTQGFNLLIPNPQCDECGASDFELAEDGASFH